MEPVFYRTYFKKHRTIQPEKSNVEREKETPNRVLIISKVLLNMSV